MADILIIDDDPRMRRLLNRLLKRAGHTVREAADGRGGIAAFAQRPADLIVTDIVMPDMEGIETIVQLRRQSPELPIIAISGGSDPLYLRTTATLGATAALRKPFAANDLLQQVVGMLADRAEPSA
jgi:CheY-like chemotaxis protein